MTIQRLRINGWDVADCYNIVETNHPTVTHPFWQFVYKDGSVIEATGAVSYLIMVAKEKESDNAI